MRKRTADNLSQLGAMVDGLANRVDKVLAYRPSSGPADIQFLQSPDDRVSLLASYRQLDLPLGLAYELSTNVMMLLAVAAAAGRETGSVTVAAGELHLWKGEMLPPFELVPVVNVPRRGLAGLPEAAFDFAMA